MNEIRILLLGEENWKRRYRLPEFVALKQMTSISELPKRSFDIVILDSTPDEAECTLLFQSVIAYRLFATENVDLDRCRWLYDSKMGRLLPDGHIQRFLLEDTRWFFGYSYGEKFRLCDIAVSRNFSGSVFWNGNTALELDGDFGTEFTQAASWRCNIPIEKGQTLDFWLEFEKSPEVSLRLTITQFASGSLSHVLQHWVFEEAQLEQIMHILGEEKGNLFISIQAKGTGLLKIIALHDRHSRGPFGHFIPGGERYVTSKKEEIFCYFDPGDMKPPLSVYFSGYKTKEGFEGLHMMRRMGGPFLLIAEARLEGGGFYMGSEEYERLMVSILNKYLNELRFTPEQMILSGISMGTSGALYYSCDLRPHAVIVGKPLADIGTVATNEKRNRPGGFPTSLDVLMYHTGDTTDDCARRLNQRFWEKFDKTDWSRTKFIVSYMLDDDYDCEAYGNMLSSLSRENAHIYGRGLRGRHNDNTHGVVEWFITQYNKVFREDFSEYDTPLRQGE